MKKHYVNNKDVFKNHSDLVSWGSLFCIALPIWLLLLSFVCSIFKIKTTFHWFPLVVYAIVFIFLGLMLGGSINYKELRFLKKQTLKDNPFIDNKVQYWYFCDPIGKTKGEIQKLLDDRFKENNYRKKGFTRLIIVLIVGLVIIIVGCFIHKLIFNALVTYPLMILITLTNYGPSADSYLDTIYPKRSYISAINWPDCICPKCGALCDPDATKTSNEQRKTWDSTYKTTLKDKYTNGWDTTIYVEREELRTATNHSSSWNENHYCTRCKHSFSKSNGYTITERH